MGEFLVLIGGMTTLISVFTFLFGVCRLIFISDNKNKSLKIILYSVIAFVIGFGTCSANFSLSGMH
ncbi:hypothetical protein AR687_05200 [Flavobacteriaceae bacterium CRH]|nr:hypothetical protein AR687_05200 [Flavobacteriaceae bacterium CRH]